MFYVASVIIFRVFLELLWKYTFIVNYRLNRLWPPWVNQFDIHALLFGGYTWFIPLGQMVLYRYWKLAFRQLMFVTVSFDIVSVVYWTLIIVF